MVRLGLSHSLQGACGALPATQLRRRRIARASHPGGRAAASQPAGVERADQGPGGRAGPRPVRAQVERHGVDRRRQAPGRRRGEAVVGRPRVSQRGAGDQGRGWRRCAGRHGFRSGVHPRRRVSQRGSRALPSGRSPVPARGLRRSVRESARRRARRQLLLWRAEPPQRGRPGPARDHLSDRRARRVGDAAGRGRLEGDRRRALDHDPADQHAPPAGERAVREARRRTDQGRRSGRRSGGGLAGRLGRGDGVDARGSRLREGEGRPDLPVARRAADDDSAVRLSAGAGTGPGDPCPAGRAHRRLGPAPRQTATALSPAPPQRGLRCLRSPAPNS